MLSSRAYIREAPMYLEFIKILTYIFFLKVLKCTDFSLLVTNSPGIYFCIWCEAGNLV